MPARHRGRQARAAHHYANLETTDDLIRHRTLGSVRSATRALAAFDPPLRQHRIRPAAASSVAAMADALTGQIMAALADLDPEEAS